MPRRVKAWKILVLMLGLLGLLFISFWIWIERVTAKKWAAMEKSVQEWIIEANARDRRRPTFHANPLPGNAWDEYELALVEMRNKPLRSVWRDFLANKPGVDRKTVEELIAD